MGIIGGLLMGLLVGAITGVTLVRLLRNQGGAGTPRAAV
jgi:NhaP-type Na+/H+ or K+/H+ antiporter